MDKKKVKLGIAPIGWTNDDMPDLGAENTYKQCISEMALAGFSGCEIGNKYPKRPFLLKKDLKDRKLKVANRWFSSFLLTKPYEEVERDFRRNCAFLKACGATKIGASEQSFSIQGTNKSIFDYKPVMTDEQWKTLCTGFNKLGAVAHEYGIDLVYHHHMGTVVQTPEEIDRLMEGTDPDKFSLLYDTGHLAYMGADYLAVLKKYVGRIKHVHLKDIRPEVIQKVKNEHLSFLQGVRLGTFTVPGDGAIDFAPVFEILEEAGYEGWILVEAEQDPAVADPFLYAKKARKYIKKIAKL